MLKLFFSIVMLWGFASPLLSQCPDPDLGLTLCGPNLVCHGSTICVDISIDNVLPTDSIVYQIDWADGSPKEIVADTGRYTHVFNTGPNCRYDPSYWIEVNATKYCADGNISVATIAAKVTIVPSPDVNEGFTTDLPFLCSYDSTLKFTYDACPRNPDIATWEWEFPSGYTVQDEYTFNYDSLFSDSILRTKEYPIALTVTTFAGQQECGSKTFIDTIPVYNAAIAQSILEDDRKPLNGDTLFTCLGGSSVFLNQSRFYDWMHWTLRPNNYRILTINEDSLLVQFQDTGYYDLEIETLSDICGPDVNTQVVRVDFPPVLLLELDTTDCQSVELNPSHFLTISDNIDSLRWDLGVHGNFYGKDPGLLNFSASDDISVTAYNVCGSLVQSANINIIEERQGSIEFPHNVGIRQNRDTLWVCRTDEAFNLRPEPLGASFRGASIDPLGRFNPQNSGPRTHQIIYGNTCIYPDTVYIVVLGEEITYQTDSVLCSYDSPTLFLANPNIGIWGGSAAINPQGNFTPQDTQAGIHHIWYEYNVEGCILRDSFEIEVIDLQAGFEVDSCKAQGNTIRVFFDTMQSSFFSNILYEFGDTGTSTEVSPFHDYSQADSYEVRLIISEKSCSDTLDKTILVEEAPIASFSLGSFSEICSSELINIQNESTGGIDSFKWYINDSLFSTNISPDPFYLPFGRHFTDILHTIRLEILGSCGEANFERSINVKPPVSANFGMVPDSLCAGDTLLIHQNSLGSPNRYWWFQNGVLISTEPQLRPKVLAAGIYEFKLVVENECTRDSMIKESYIAPTNVSAFFELTDPKVCMEDTIKVESFATPFSTTFWKWGDMNTSQGSSSFHVYQDTGRFTITQLVQGCGVDSFQLEVEIDPIPNLNLVHDRHGCTGIPIEFEIETDASTYNFYIPGIFSTNNRKSCYTFDTPGNYSLIVEALSKDYCEARETSSLEIHASPTAEIQFESPSCTQTLIPFQSISTGNIVSWNWDFGDHLREYGKEIYHSYASEGTYSVGLTVETSMGCFAYSEREISILKQPSADFFILPRFENDAQVSLDNRSVDAQSYRWEFGDGNISSEIHPRYEYRKRGTYTINLFAFNTNICVDSISQKIHYFPDEKLFIPSAFSPNNDGLNDFFQIGTVEIASLDIKIFNRWGQEIFETQGMNMHGGLLYPWDGKMKNGSLAPEGIYIFVCKAKNFEGELILHETSVTLFR